MRICLHDVILGVSKAKGQVSGSLPYDPGTQLVTKVPLWVVLLIKLIFSLLQSAPLLQMYVMVRIVVLQFSYTRETVRMQPMYLLVVYIYKAPAKTVAGVAGGIDWK